MTKTLTDLHLQQIAKAAATKLQMICFRADGTEIERRTVSRLARFSMQAVSDQKAANKAKAELGAELDHVKLPWVTLHFNEKGLSFRKSA